MKSLFGKSDAIADKTALRRRYEVAVMPLLCGKSKLQYELSRYGGPKRVVPFDADSLADSIVRATPELQALDTPANACMLEAMLFPKLEERMKGFLETLPEAVVLCITSNVRFCDYLGVKDKRCSVFLPSAELYATILKDLTASSGAESAALCAKSRDEILIWAQGMEHVYSSLTDIVKVLAEKFGLRLSAI